MPITLDRKHAESVQGIANSRNEARAAKSKFNLHHFICFDGEGYEVNGRHEYVYLCAYDGKRYYSVRNDSGLNTSQCFKFITSVAAKFPEGICVVYGGSYDSNMMLRDIPIVNLQCLRRDGWTFWRDYRIEFVPRKYFQVTNTRTGATIRLWDVIGFFQAKFTESLKKWLGVNSDLINKGKAKRSKFKASDIETIVTYCKEELLYFEQLCQELWNCLNAANVRIKRWDGVGAIAQQLMTNYGIYEYKGSKVAQDEHYYFARCAYAGGRFELFQPGDFRQKVYMADINSAYPYAISLLPEFVGLVECPQMSHGKCKIGEYDLLQLEYTSSGDFPIHPYFHRGHFSRMTFPYQHRGWHWAPEYLAAWNTPQPEFSKTKILRHFKFMDNGRRPFAWVQDKYDERRVLILAKDPSEKVIKLGLNSLYGKLAQQKGWHEGQSIPRFHQLYWAGWVTAKCRSMIYKAIMQSPHSIIATETDSVFSTVKLDLPYGTGLGEWEYEEYDWITYVQSGLYFAGIGTEQRKLRSRGMNAKSITREQILNGWHNMIEGDIDTETVSMKITRFHTLASSLHTGHMEQWRQWIVEDRDVSLVPAVTSKRAHDSLYCKGGDCEGWGENRWHTTGARLMRNEDSEPYPVLWDADTSDELEMQYHARLVLAEDEIVYE